MKGMQQGTADGTFLRTHRHVVDIHELAYLTGSDPGSVQRAGAALFEALAGQDPDLSKALIAASNASGVEPKHVILMMTVLAEQFRGAAKDGTIDPSHSESANESGSGDDPRDAPLLQRLLTRTRPRRGKTEENSDG